MQGPVARVETFSSDTSLPDQKDQDGPIPFDVRVYDERGNRIEETQHHEDGTLLAQRVFEFDPLGNVLSSRVQVSDELFIYEDRYRYDDFGNRLEHERYAIHTLTDERELREQHSFEYDEAGHLTKTVHLDAEGLVVASETFLYHESGFLLERTRYYGDEDLRSKVIYRHHGDGERIEEDHFHSDGTLRYTAVRHYDGAGNELEYAFFQADGLPAEMAVFDEKIGSVQVFFTARSRFDESGNELEYVTLDLDGDPLLWRSQTYQESGRSSETILYGENGEIESRRTQRFDTAGHVLERILYNPDGGVVERWVYETEYDSYGNWIWQARHRSFDEAGENLSLQTLLYRTLRYNVPKTMVYTSACDGASHPVILPLLTVTAPLPEACVRVTPLRQIPPPRWALSVISEVVIPHPVVRTGTSAPQEVAIAPAVEIRPYPRFYTVVPGDSLWSIAEMFRLNVEDLKVINSLESDLIHPGQVLKTR
ncbi:MAG: LysM peptidoglycan-binding domain-containing protein [Trueperaceae bacterium]|nr:MAG: LysM peptidoglycan-binding domain-containing protein [Trueperaceae bacterium]